MMTGMSTNMDILTLENEITMLSQYLRNKSPSDIVPHPKQTLQLAINYIIV
jgi:hypothetical protein